MSNKNISSQIDTTSSEEYSTPGSSLINLTESPLQDDIFFWKSAVVDIGFKEIYDVTIKDCPRYDSTQYSNANTLEYLVKCTDENMFIIKEATQEQTINICNSESDIGYETGSCSSADQNLRTPKGTNSLISMSLIDGKDKPTIVVPPAVNKSTAGSRSFRCFNLPTLAHSMSSIVFSTQVSVDKEMNSESDTSMLQIIPNSTPLKGTKPESSDRLCLLRAIIRKKQQDTHNLHLEHMELKYNLDAAEKKCVQLTENMDDKIKKLTDDKNSTLINLYKLSEELNQKKRSNKQLIIVMEEHDKSLNSLINDKQMFLKRHIEIKSNISSEKDATILQLSNVEYSFNDLFSKYVRSKSVAKIIKYKEKEFMDKLLEHKNNVKTYETLYENLKLISNEELEKANETLDNINKKHSVEIAKTNANSKMNELMILSLKNSLSQKLSDNQNLSDICDELLSKIS